MVSLRLRSLSGRFSLRRASWDSTRSTSTTASETPSCVSASTAAGAVNSSISRVPSIAGLVEEHRNFSSELGILEPRPVVYWESMEEKMGMTPLVV
ncbi:hypothetical protein GMORB2_6047 [Geosmithia morbida]|uniref:Uncharacterized protein n=1 Tax=Geosmithia morbida TaxID=1094350 RepID=A0A9P5D4B1_9HYPO|nr:uncharacterized protein GMORB2_6047 [Geosmithia morbida]KAF4123346.1 hypothetical protein GMORB2_6047 [Geosmithia morbida]